MEEFYFCTKKNSHSRLFRKTVCCGPGVDKVREQGAPLPGNDKENWRNDQISATEIYEEEEKGEEEKEEKEEKRE